jgi:hypothetical protein
MSVIDPSELIGHTFLMDKEDRQWHHVWILNKVLANMKMNSSGNVDTYNLFALSMMMATKRSFPTMSWWTTLRRTNSSWIQGF